MNKYPEMYLGDSVYARYDGYSIILYLDNGMGENSHIHLEPEVLDNLQTFCMRVTELSKGLKGEPLDKVE